MATRGINFKWYDGFFLSMLVTSIVFVVANWKRYDLCIYPLNVWIVVDYVTVLIFRILMFVDNWVAAGMELDLGRQQRYVRFVGRLVILCTLGLCFYPFLWVWTVIGTYWFSRGKSCLVEQGQKWGFLIWLCLSFGGLSFIGLVMAGKWLTRRNELLGRAQGNSISAFRVVVDMIRVPEWAFEAAQREVGRMVQEPTYLPGLFLTPSQMEVMEGMIQNLPKLRLRAIPEDFGECPICLEDFQLEEEVRCLRCAHTFHVDCIDNWLRLNAKCPRCRCFVFSHLNLHAMSNDPASPESVIAATFVASSPPSRSYILRIHDFFGVERVGSVNNRDVETGSNGTDSPVATTTITTTTT